MKATNVTRGAIAAVLVAFSGSALAADVDAPVWRSAPPESVYSWTGFYVGANVGVGVSDTPTNVNIANAFFPAFDSGAASVVGGLQIGYNYQMGMWVFGVEADIQGTTQGSSDNCVLGCFTGLQRLTQTTDLPWFGTVRGRIGTQMGGLLFYYTGGFAYGDVKTHISETFGSSGTLDFTETRFGWTVGSGIEAALGGNWTGRAEYLFVDLGKTTGAYRLAGVNHSYSTDVQEHVFRLGLNYRFGPTAQVPPSLMQPKNWNGFYAGFNVGNGVGRNPASFHVSTPILVAGLNDTFDFEPTGWFGGAQVGYNYQVTNIVLGFETDIQGGWQNTDQNCTSAGLLVIFGNLPSACLKQELPMWGTVRGRAGYSMGPALFFVTGGFAYGQVKHTITETLPGFGTGTFNSSQMLTGFTVGGGLETPLGPIFNWALPNVTIRTEYLYMDLGDSVTKYNFAGAQHTLVSDTRNHVFRTAVNYQFNGPQ